MQAEVLMSWADVLADRSLRDLPYKVELNAQGQIVMSPAGNRHGIVQTQIAMELSARAGGTAWVEGAIQCSDGSVRVADVVWMSSERQASHGMPDPMTVAPEICVEVTSPSNTAAEMSEKVRLTSKPARRKSGSSRSTGRAPCTLADPDQRTTEGHTPMSMADRDGKIWMDGKLVEWRDATIHVLTHTLHYGCGAFEGVRAYMTPQGTSIFRLKEHTRRLFDSAKILRLKIPFAPEQVMEAQRTVVRENKLESCYLRPLVWIGSEKLGVSAKGNTIHCMVAAWPWGAYLGEDGLRRGIRVKTSSFTRHHVNITMTQAKAVSNYTNSILANHEATEDGYDEALLLDPSGFVSEGSGENLFVVKNGVVYTPDLGAGALNGITRNTIMAICADLGLTVVEKRITRDEVYICDEAFFTGTAAEVTPVRELDRIEIGEGGRGPITEKIQAAYFDIVEGRNPKYAEWLTPV